MEQGIEDAEIISRSHIINGEVENSNDKDEENIEETEEDKLDSLFRQFDEKNADNPIQK